MSTVFEKYQRLEASALWREAPDAQRREVIISIGQASLLISDLQDRPLGHWSLAAVQRLNPGKSPAILTPDGSDNETLELAANESEMLAAIETLQKLLHKGKPKPGRLRWAIVLGSALAVAAGGVFWLPNALRNHVVGLVPDLNRVVIGHDVVAHMERTTGAFCQSTLADPVLRKLANALGVSEILIVPEGIKTTASLPGPALLINRRILEDTDVAEAAIGYMLAEAAYAVHADPLSRLLDQQGVWASFRLLTSGKLSDETLKAYGAHITLTEAGAAPIDDLVMRFSDLGLSASPYAYSIDISGETTLPLIEADALFAPADPLLSDSEWVALQNICAQ